MSERRRPRLVDLANRLDVAPSTVSRALAGSSSVSPSTRERVRRAAAELGYTVNLAASGLKRGRTLNIGLIAVMTYWYSGAVTSGADRVAAAQGYDFVVMNAAGGLDEDLLVQRARRLGQRVDGAIVVDIREGSLLDDVVAALGVPVVTLGCRAAATPSVTVDNEAIGGLAAQHARSLGHRSAVVLSPANPSPLAFDNASIRSTGFINAFGPATASDAWIPNGTHDVRRRAILSATADVTAVFCTTDALAIEVVATLREHGRPVPDEVSVIGVDGRPIAGALGLTTVAQMPEAMGEVAAQMVIAAARDDAPGECVVSDVRLEAGRTTGPPQRQS